MPADDAQRFLWDIRGAMHECTYSRTRPRAGYSHDRKWMRRYDRGRWSMADGASSTRATILAVAVILAAGCAAYVNSLWGVFVFDDIRMIVDSAQVRDPWSTLTLDPTARPVTMFTLALNYAVDGLDPTGYHAVNIAIHLGAGMVLFGIIRRTLCTAPMRDRFASHATVLATLIAVLWVVHPIQTQSVTYIIQRGEALMGLCYLLVLYCVIRAADTRHHAAMAWQLAGIAAFIVGMGAKQVIVTAPVVVLLYDRTFLARSFAGALRGRWLILNGITALAVTLAVLSLIATAEAGGGVGYGLQDRSPLDYPLAQPVVIWQYLHLIAWPYPQCLDYMMQPVRSYTTLALAHSALVVLLVLIGWAVVRRRPIGFAGAWFFLILAPTSSIVPILDLKVEHRLYLSLAAPLAVALLVLHRAARGRVAVVTVVAGAAAVAFTCLTVLRNFDYYSIERIWTQCLTVAPHNWRAREALAQELSREGEHDAAIREFDRVLDLVPLHAPSYRNRAAALIAAGHLERAEADATHAARLNPSAPGPHVLLGVIALQRRAADEAEAHFHEALRLDPDDLLTHRQLAVLLFNQQRFGEAARHLRIVCTRNPRDADMANRYGAALANLGELDAAIAQFRRALALQPDHPDARRNLDMAMRERDELR